MNGSIPRPAAPEWGKRPRNRQKVIIAAAADLFADRGFSNVSMSDIAEAVKVQPSALYRHFSGKQDLLQASIAQGVAIRTQAVGEGASGDSLDAIVSRLVQSALATRSLSSLWTNEVRLLEADKSRELRRQIRALPETLARRLAEVREELPHDNSMLLAWAFLDTLASISLIDESISDKEMTRVLQQVGLRVLRLDLAPEPVDPMNGAAVLADPFAPRRERLALAACSLFRRRGFNAVTLEDIGRAEGISGPGVYTHFNSKQEILDGLLVRGVEWERHSVARATAHTTDGQHYCAGALRGYVQFTDEAPDLAWMRLTETRHASDNVAQRTLSADREEVARWCAALKETRPGAELPQLRVEVRAARTAALDLLTTAHLRGFGASVETVTQICAAILGLPDHDPKPQGPLPPPAQRSDHS